MLRRLWTYVLLCIACLMAMQTSVQSQQPGNILHLPLTGELRILMIRIHYPGEYAGILSMQEARAHAEQVINGLKVNSYDKLSNVIIDITNDLEMPNTQSYYEIGPTILKIRKDAFKSAEGDGFDVSSYDRIIIFSKYIWKGARGIGTINFQVIFTSSNTPWVTLHELGHSFGWRHANFWQVTQGSPISPNGNLVEYGDKFDLMGGSAGPPPYTESNFHHYNPFYKQRVGWVSSSNVLTITQPGTYWIHTVNNAPAPGEYVALRLRKNPKTEYWIYYRSSEVPDGPLISQMFTNNIMPTRLLDMTPGSKPGQGEQFFDWQDARLAVGETFDDPQLGVTVEAVQRTDDSVEVKITGFPPQVADLPVIDVVSPRRSDDVFGRINYEATAFSPQYGNFNGAGIAKTKLFLYYLENVVISNLRQGIDPPPEHLIASKEFDSPPYRWTFDSIKDVSSPLDLASYFLVIRAISVDGDTNTVWYEHIIDNSLAPPSAPSLLAPPNNSTDLQTDLTFFWSMGLNTDSFRIQVAIDSNFSSPLVDESGLTQGTYVAHDLANGTQYYWRVNGENQNGVGDWSEVRTFQTIIARPGAPMLLAPSNNSIDLQTDLTFSWAADMNADSYRIQVASDSNFSLPLVDQSGLTDVSYVVNSLVNDTQYYWRVNAENKNGVSDWSDTWTFQTIIAAPETPTLLEPPDNATGVDTNPVLQWNESARADSYAVQVAKISDFSDILIEQKGITETSFQLTNLDNKTKYYWRVRAFNPGGESNNSDGWSFTTKEVTSIDEGNDPIPTKFNLAQNYPNPFNPVTTIEFELPKKGLVTLTIVNALGTQVETLVSEERAAGKYKVQWDAHGYPSGVYFYRLVTPFATQTRKMILLK